MLYRIDTILIYHVVIYRFYYVFWAAQLARVRRSLVKYVM